MKGTKICLLISIVVIGLLSIYGCTKASHSEEEKSQVEHYVDTGAIKRFEEELLRKRQEEKGQLISDLRRYANALEIDSVTVKSVLQAFYDQYVDEYGVDSED